MYSYIVSSFKSSVGRQDPGQVAKGKATSKKIWSMFYATLCNCPSEATGKVPRQVSNLRLCLADKNNAVVIISINTISFGKPQCTSSVIRTNKTFRSKSQRSSSSATAIWSPPANLFNWSVQHVLGLPGSLVQPPISNCNNLCDHLPS